MWVIVAPDHRARHVLDFHLDADLFPVLLEERLRRLARRDPRRRRAREFQLDAILLADAVGADAPAGLVEHLGGERRVRRLFLQCAVIGPVRRYADKRASAASSRN